MLKPWTSPRGWPSCAPISNPSGRTASSSSPSPPARTGFTRKGFAIQELFAQLGDCPAIDALGLNCMSGPYHYPAAAAPPAAAEKAAGHPAQRGLSHRGGRSDVFWRQPRLFCGSDGRYRLLRGSHPRRLLRQPPPSTSARPPGPPPRRSGPDGGRRHPRYLPGQSGGRHRQPAEKQAGQRQAGHRRGAGPAGGYRPVLFPQRRRSASSAWRWTPITIADCPVARARVDSSLLAAKIHRELDVDVLPHLTCP